MTRLTLATQSTKLRTQSPIPPAPPVPATLRTSAPKQVPYNRIKSTPNRAPLLTF